MIINPVDIILGPIVALDLETTGLQAWEEKIDLIALKSEKTTYVLEVHKYIHEDLKKLFDRLAACQVVIAHNAKFDAAFIYYHYGVLLKNLHCTEMGAEICENGNQKRLRRQYEKTGIKPFSLIAVLQRWLGIKHKDFEKKKLWQKSFISSDATIYRETPIIRNQQISYAAEDVEHLEELYKVEMARIDELDLQVIYKLEHKLLPILVKMEVEGCLIDASPWKELIDTRWRPEQEALERRLDAEVLKLLNGRKFKYHVNRIKRESEQFGLFGESTTALVEDPNLLNYASTEQLQELILFCGEQLPTNDEGGPSLEEDPMVVFLTENPTTKLSTFIELLLEHRQISKLVSTYGDKFLSKLDKHGRIHTSYTQTKTETGRLSSKSPNLQNIPKPPKGDLTKDIRRFFIAPQGKTFITCDMSGAEVAIAADYSGEPLLLDALVNGADMHSELASVSFSIIFKNETTISKSSDKIQIDGKEYTLSELRDDHKSVVFAKFYKGGAKRIYGVLSNYINAHHGASVRESIAQQISNALDNRMPVLSQYLSSLITAAQKNGWLRASSFGRIRFFDSKVYGEAANYPIQGTNADALKMALIKLSTYFDQHPEYSARLVMNIHDEVVVECDETRAEELAPIIQDIMAQSLSYFLTKIKGGASVSISKHWQK